MAPSTTRTGPARLLVTAVVAAAVALTAACGDQQPVAAPSRLPDVTVTPTVEPSRTTPPAPVIPVSWPLTGLETTEVAARPAVAVKVENTAAARPQSGLEHADVVWETVVEFEISRFIAIYHSQMSPEVGPIRSVRPMDIPITEPLGGVLAFSGGQSGILRDVEVSTVQALGFEGGADGMYRVRGRRIPHNLYGSTAAFAAQADGSRAVPPAPQFLFSRFPQQATATLVGAPASSVSLRMSRFARPSWTWDASSARWLRSEGGAPAVSASGARLSATNVVVVAAPQLPSAYRAQAGENVPTYDLLGQGPAMVATGGKVLEGTWVKGSNTEPMRLYTADGAELLLAPGTTWVELLPAGTGRIDTA